MFDFDGVVVNTEPLHYQAVLAGINNPRVHFFYTTYLERYQCLPIEQMITKILTDHETQPTSELVSSIADKKQKIYRQLLKAQTSHAMKHIEDLLIYLSMVKRIKLGLCTSSSKSEVRTVLLRSYKLHLLEYFNAIVTSDNVKQCKPSPEGYKLLSEKLQVTPEECLVIEDSINGIKAGQAASMSTCFMPSQSYVSASPPCNYRISQLTEVYSII